MTITFTMTSRMMTIAGVCALLFCVVLFVLGMQIGAQYGHPAAHVRGATAVDTADASAVAGTLPDANINTSSPAASSPLSSDTSKQ